MKRLLLTVLCLALTLGVTSSSYADRRSYVWTYEYQTMPKGMAEIEYYLTEEQRDIEKAKPNIWKHWFELEYGITDHLDISMYQQFKQSNTTSSSTFEYDGFKIRARYRILEKDKLPLDTLLYLEYIRNDNLERPNVMEAKVILAKDIWNFNIAYNQIFKQELESGGKTEHEYATGLSYAIIPQLKIGLESKGNYTAKKYYAGPTASWSTKEFWFSLGAAFGLNERTDDVQTRMIIGIPF